MTQFSGLETVISCALGVALGAMAWWIISGHLTLTEWLGVCAGSAAFLALKLFL